MASSALGRSLSRCGSLRRDLRSNPRPCASAAAGGTFHHSFQSEPGVGETTKEFEYSLFGKNGSDEGSFYRNLDKVENAGRRYGMGTGMDAFGGSGNQNMGGFDSLNDAMSGMLGDAARNFRADNGEDDLSDDFEFRPDVEFQEGATYIPRDLDLTRPAAPKDPSRPQFETTTEEVLRKADFRNVRFLSNFITEAGIIIKRSQEAIRLRQKRGGASFGGGIWVQFCCGG